MLEGVLKREEAVMLKLRALYRQYGYSLYKMGKFEEYDLYVRNKSFLASDQIITFTDLNGKLMALKPDVTLSIVKNTKDCGKSLCKYFYNENVYRPSHSGREFKERMQVGLECIGDIDVYSTAEVVMLAERSLRTISDRALLDISHMGFLSGLLESLNMSPEHSARILRCISEKNAHEIERLCSSLGVPDLSCERLRSLASFYGTFEDAFGLLEDISCGPKTDEALRELEQVYEAVRGLGAGDTLRLDFSVVNDMNYYSGIIFRGFVDGVPTGVLSGGRYDNLMQRLGKSSGAIGFAVYLDLLERHVEEGAYDVDVLLLYDEPVRASDLAGAVRSVVMGGQSVRVQRAGAEIPEIKYRRLVVFRGGRLEEVGQCD